MLRTLECSDLAEPCVSIWLEENGLRGKRANSQPHDIYLAFEGPVKKRKSGDKSPRSNGIAQHQKAQASC